MPPSPAFSAADQEIISGIVSLITQNFEVDAIYLYGSRAKGTPHASSDWDIAVLF